MKKYFYLKLSEQELEDLMSATDFFISDYSKKGSTQTRRAMTLILKKLWKVLKRGPK